ncbi:MAG: IS1634 family transposase, partial [Mariprofundaceae bacterium]
MKEKFGIERLIMVGDRGLITQARITEDLASVDGLDWISALRSSAIQKLVTTGALQLSLFDKQDMAEITSDDFPGERLVVCRNPLLADERTRKRQALLTATEILLQEVVDATQREKRPFKGKDKIALRVGKIINKYKMSKHFI